MHAACPSTGVKAGFAYRERQSRWRSSGPPRHAGEGDSDAATSQTCSPSGDSIQVEDASEGSHAVRRDLSMPGRADWAVGYLVRVSVTLSAAEGQAARRNANVDAIESIMRRLSLTCFDNTFYYRKDIECAALHNADHCNCRMFQHHAGIRKRMCMQCVASILSTRCPGMRVAVNLRVMVFMQPAGGT
jgi:hypothetical protein